MTPRDRFEGFAGRFVLAPFRKRFVHEALKKPGKLHGRICHQIESVFSPRYAKGTSPFQSGDTVFPIIGTDFDGRDCKWEQIESSVGKGYGILFASADLHQFYAETETESGSPFVIYSSG